MNGLSPKFAWVIMSWMCTPAQNFITIALEGFAPHIGEVANHVFLFFFWFFLLCTAKAAEPILTLNTSIGVVLRKDVAFGDPEYKILYLDPNFPPKNGNFGAILGDRKFRLKTRFNMEGSKSKHPLNAALRV